MCLFCLISLISFFMQGITRMLWWLFKHSCLPEVPMNFERIFVHQQCPCWIVRCVLTPKDQVDPNYSMQGSVVIDT